MRFKMKDLFPTYL